MPLSDIQPPATKHVLTGWGAPLLYAPDRCHLAEVGPMDPIKWVLYCGIRVIRIQPLIQRFTINGLEWEPYDQYGTLTLPNCKDITPSIQAVYAQ